MDAVAIITGPRTGAGHLVSLLDNVEAVAHSGGLFADGFADAAGRLDRAERDAHAAGKSMLVFTLTSAAPRDVVAREILDRPGMRAIIVMRRQVDAYVSLAKAMALGAWRDTDLTNVKVKLDAARFADWMAGQEAWYAHWRRWLERRGLPVPVIRYETQIQGLPADTVLRRFSACLSQLGLTLPIPAELPHAGLVRQDRERTVAFKVRNWPDFSRGLSERGIDKRAFGYPI